MHLFETTKKNIALLGIDSTESANPSSRKTVLGFLILGLSLTFNFLFLILEANTFGEYTQSSYMVSAAVSMLLMYSYVIFKEEKFFKFMKRCENTLGTVE